MMHRTLLIMALITSAVSRNDEELCRDMFESFIEGMSMQPSPQYCRGVSHLNNVLKLTSPVAHACREYGLELAWSDVVPYFYLLVFRAKSRCGRTPTDAVILQQSLKLGKGGSTTVTGIPIDGQKLMVAKFGDSRAVMSRNGVVHQLSVDHEPSNERRYIEKRGGFVSNIPGDVPRVDGQLVIAKAFGDKRLKIHLSSEPDITHQAVGDQNEFIVFASDGI
ncbi:unnamed protein product [Brassica rapa]|uniref:PPM-type phosphatase domain-containing protein n=1 Tax=Brassica campestris TaxID=3711 RepID=A0A8D9LV42_BRACM|nr:unnamed protein product [Brassica rapa]